MKTPAAIAKARLYTVTAIAAATLATGGITAHLAGAHEGNTAASTTTTTTTNTTTTDSTASTNSDSSDFGSVDSVQSSGDSAQSVTSGS